MSEPEINPLNMNSADFIQMKVSPPHAESRQKRSQFDFMSDYNNNNNNNRRNSIELPDDEDAQPFSPTEATLQRTNDDFDAESLTPFTYFLLLQKLRQLQSHEHEPTYRVRTPRLGRSIDLQMLDDIGTGSGLLGRGFDIGATLTRLSKKSVPFKPRLGKRTKYCD